MPVMHGGGGGGEHQDIDDEFNAGFLPLICLQCR